MSSLSSQSLIQQKRLQWAREKEEMLVLSGLWGSNKSIQLPPISSPAGVGDEDETTTTTTSGYTSDSAAHQENDWVGGSREEVRAKWGDRGVGVGHLWEPVTEMPDAPLPQVLESMRSTPRWVERILLVQNNDDDDDHHHHHESENQSRFLLGQNTPLPAQVLEERERKRRKALEHQMAIRKQLEERERKRKEDKENRLREERLEEERIFRAQQLERKRREREAELEASKTIKEKERHEQMQIALQQAEKAAQEQRSRATARKRAELNRINEKKEKNEISCQTLQDTRDIAVQYEDDLLLIPDKLALLVPQPQLRIVTNVQTQTLSPRSSTCCCCCCRCCSSSSSSCCSSSTCFKSRATAKCSIRERPKWGINRPTVQYLKQSEKDPHYARRMKRRNTARLLRSEARLLPAHPDLHRNNDDDDDGDEKQKKLLQLAFRMDSGRSSPRFVPITNDQCDDRVEREILDPLKALKMGLSAECKNLESSASPSSSPSSPC